MNYDYYRLKDDFVSLGLKTGDSVMIHSSYKSMGEIDGGIETVVSALLSVIGETGTLIAPAFTFSSVTPQNPVFDYVNSPSCVGAISEYIRNIKESKRSINPTHSCSAIGNETEYYVGTHYVDNTPVGVNSPLFKLKENGGKILMLGCHVGSNTIMHGVEEAFGAWYLLTKKASPYTIILPDRTYETNYYRHDMNGYAQRYDRIVDIIDSKYMNTGLVLRAKSYLFDAKGLWNTAINALEQNELYFVEKRE